MRAITDEVAGTELEAAYRPFGEQVELAGSDPSKETKSFIGERYDDDSGLQYLNARYYDPELGIFIQPDWFEVTKPGVGTNRYAYSFNDPVNLADPNGNFVPLAVWGAIAAYKAISVAITVVDTVQTVQSLADGSTTVGEAAKEVAKGAVVGATVGKGAAKAPEKVGDAAKGAVKRFVKEETGSVPGGVKSPGISIGRKIERQMEKRGWDEKTMKDTISNPTRTGTTRDTRYNSDGVRNDDPATAYFDSDGNYVVKNDKTGDIVQVSDKNDPNWKTDDSIEVQDGD